MALIGSISIRLGVDQSRLITGLNSSAKLVDSWSSKVGGGVDSAIARMGTAKSVGSITSAMGKLANASHKVRTALDFADLGRYAGKAATGVAGIGMAFAGSGEKAEAMRAGLVKANDALTTLGAVSLKARKALLFVDAANFLVKLGSLGGGALGKVGSGLLSVAAGSARVVSGLGSAARGVSVAATNAVRLTSSLGELAVGLGRTAVASGKYVTGFGSAGAVSKAAGKAFLSAVEAFATAPRIGAGLLSIGSGLAYVGSGAIKALGGVARFGVGMAKLGVSAFSSALSGLRTTLGGAASAFLSVGAAAVKFAAIGGVVAGVFGVKAASAAAHLNETINTTEQVFGSSASSIIKNSEMMNAAFATNRKEFLEGANALGGQFQGVGFAEKDAAALSVQLLKLAADATASRDPLGGFAESLGKIRSGLSGEAEPLKAWGIALDEQAVKAQAVTMGLVKQGEELTNAAKVQARLAIITQGLAKDQGALAREATGPAAQMAEFWGRAQTLMETVGQSIAPALGAALVEINTGIVAIGLAWDASKESVFGWATGTLESIGLADKGALTLQGSIGFLADAWGVVKGATAGFFSYFEAGIARVSGWIAKIFEGLSHIGGGEWAKGWQKSIEEYSASAKTVSVDLGQSMQDAFSGKNLASAQVDKFFGEAKQKIADARAAASQAAGDAIGAPKATDVVGKKQSAKDPFAGAQLAGSSDAASTVLRTKYGGGKDPTAENTKRTADLIAENNKIQRQNQKLLSNRANSLASIDF